jgi:two-component system, NtrC family, sensor kinase
MTAIPDKTAADPQQIIAELERKLDERTSERDEALERQTATADILQVIARSPSDVQPVFDAVAERAMSLLNCWSAIVVSFDGELVHFGAARGALPDTEQIVRQRFQSMQPYRASLLGRCLLERTVVNSADAQAEPDPQLRDYARKRGLRAVLCVPLLRDDKVEGALVLTRAQSGLFAPREIELVQTFADQAVIAIHNARLFNETKQALEHQTATSEVLQVIGNSMADAKPVFERIVNSIERLFDCRQMAIFVTPGDGFVHLAARRGMNMELMDEVYPLPIEQSAVPAVLGARQQIYYPDALNGANVPQSIRRVAQVIGNFSDVLTPMLWEGRGVGMIAVTREPNTPFNSKELSLLRTFADQAVIAIENARLFNEVQAKTRDLTESLQQQTATAEVLKVISRSAFNLQAVLTTLVRSALDLCNAPIGTFFLREGDVLRVATQVGCPPELVQYFHDNPIPLNQGSGAGRAFLTGRVVHFPDVLADPDYRLSEAQRLGGFRSLLAVPLLREQEAIGVFSLSRTRPEPFSPRQIDLVTTFADQAVIAIENVRLFDEVQERTRELAASLDDLRTAQDRLVQTEKLASLGQLTAGIAHEIKNPLNFVNNFSALSVELVGEMKDALSDTNLDKNKREELDEIAQTLKGNLEKIVQHGKRADSIVKNMLQHSREGSGEHRPADINAIVDESLNLAYHGARAEKAGFSIAFQRDLDPSVGMADVYPQEITRVLLNLISNGFYATAKRKAEAGDGFEPMLSATTRNLGDKVEIRIRDNGTGIPEGVKEKIFNPFFTTKPSGEGTGLGLSMSHDIIVKQHGGCIDVETEPGLFTEFKILLPRRNQR